MKSSAGFSATRIAFITDWRSTASESAWRMSLFWNCSSYSGRFRYSSVAPGSSDRLLA